MRPAPPSRSLAPEKPFRLLGGDPSLDLVNTVSWTAQGPAADRLTDYGRLVEWAEAAGLVPAADARRLRAAAARDPVAAAAAHEAARCCRWVLQRLFAAVAAGERPADALAEFNALLRDTNRHLALDWAAGRAAASGGPAAAPLRWTWLDGVARLDRVLWPVVRAAATLLASDEVARVRTCEGPDCGWMYVDRSRNRLRRWCDMGDCGTREKSRRRAERRQAAD